MVLSHTDGWKTSQRWLAEQTEYEGLTVVRNALKQLERCGYLTRSVERKYGRIVAHIMIWREDPVAPEDCEDSAPNYIRERQGNLQTLQNDENLQLVDNQRSHQNAGNALLVNPTSGKTAHTEYHQNQNTMQTEDNRRSALTPVQQKMEKLKLKLSASVANNLDRRQASKEKGNASGVWKIWADAYRSATGQNPSEPTQADLAIMFRTSRRLFSANVAKIEAGLKWVCERWTTIRVSHFSWMRQTPSPMLPDVRFFTKFSDRFDEAFRDAARVEETAKAPARQQNIDRLVRKGYSKEAAAAKAIRDEAEEQQTTELNQAAESASKAARGLAMERSKTAQADEAAPRWRRLRSAPVVATGAYEDDSTLPSL